MLLKTAHFQIWKYSSRFFWKTTYFRFSWTKRLLMTKKKIYNRKLAGRCCLRHYSRNQLSELRKENSMQLHILNSDKAFHVELCRIYKMSARKMLRLRIRMCYDPSAGTCFSWQETDLFSALTTTNPARNLYCRMKSPPHVVSATALIPRPKL